MDCAVRPCRGLKVQVEVKIGVDISVSADVSSECLLFQLLKLPFGGLGHNAMLLNKKEVQAFKYCPSSQCRMVFRLAALHTSRSA